MYPNRMPVRQRYTATTLTTRFIRLRTRAGRVRPTITVSGINYGAPYGVMPTSNVTFGYDAAGNRISMTDGLGSASYIYNSLSQMTFETRTFTNVGTYTLGYDYNLAGELKTFTSPFNETLTYGFDSVGRVQNINASGYYPSQFLSSAQYRAWGTLKSATYGDGAIESAGYNSRLEITNRQIQSGNYQSLSTHQYYDDGGLRFSHSPDDRFDRAFTYDHAARVSEAYSGSEARDFVNGTNSGAPTGPYRQSYQYDGFSQTPSRQIASGARRRLPTILSSTTVFRDGVTMQMAH